MLSFFSPYGKETKGRDCGEQEAAHLEPKFREILKQAVNHIQKSLLTLELQGYDLIFIWQRPQAGTSSCPIPYRKVTVHRIVPWKVKTLKLLRDSLVQIWLIHREKNWGPERKISGTTKSGSQVFWQPVWSLFLLPHTASQELKSKRFSPPTGCVAKPVTWIIFFDWINCLFRHHVDIVKHSSPVFSMFGWFKNLAENLHVQGVLPRKSENLNSHSHIGPITKCPNLFSPFHIRENIMFLPQGKQHQNLEGFLNCELWLLALILSLPWMGHIPTPCSLWASVSPSVKCKNWTPWSHRLLQALAVFHGKILIQVSIHSTHWPFPTCVSLATGPSGTQVPETELCL